MDCVTVSYGDKQGTAKQYQYFRLSIYTDKVRKKDGKRIWTLKRREGAPYRSYKLTETLAKNYASINNIPYLENIRQNTLVNKKGKLK